MRLRSPPSFANDCLIRRAEYVAHEVTCANACQNGGCCSLGGICACPDGWTGPTCAVPVSTCGNTAAVVPGVRARYYSDMAFQTLVATRVESDLRGLWSYSNPLPSVPGSQHSIVWDGFLVPAHTGWHRFTIDTVQRTRFAVDGRMLAVTQFRFSMAFCYLTAGRRHPFVLDYVSTGNSFITLRAYGPNSYPVSLLRAR
jgi:hypothetical protein